MNILLATDGNVEHSGICAFMLNWVNTLMSNYDINTCTCYFRKSVNDKDVLAAYEQLGIHVYTSGVSAENTTIEAAEMVKNDIRKILEQDHYDIIHINSSAMGFTTVLLQEAKRSGVRIRISHSHGRNLDGRIKRIYHRLLRGIICKNATTYAGCSKDAGIYMFGENGVNSKRWKFIPNTIDTIKFSFNSEVRERYREKLGICSDDYLLGAVGYLERIKNHSFLLDVIRGLKDQGVSAFLMILGNGSLLEELQHKARRLDISENVIFFGVSSEVDKWLSAFDCYVMPSLSEGLGISAVEAQSNGLPCLLSDHVPSEVDLIKNVYHLSIDEGTQAWINKVLELLKWENKGRENAHKTVADRGFGNVSLLNYIDRLYFEK